MPSRPHGPQCSTGRNYDQLQICSGWRWLYHAVAEFLLATESLADGESQAAILMVSLQHSCPGEGLNIRLDASLKEMRTLAAEWRFGHPQMQAWREAAEYFLGYDSGGPR